jgi:hypothetical protein
MGRKLRLGGIVVMLAVGVMLGTRAASKVSPEQGGVHRLVNAAPSEEELIERFLQAVADNDRAALGQLRLTEAEYREIILPGNVDPGQPFRMYPEEVSKYAWQNLNTRSLYHEDSLLVSYGGRTLSVKAVEYENGSKTYASYKARKRLRLSLVDADGSEVQLATGSIAEIDGQFKFISFIRD